MKYLDYLNYNDFDGLVLIQIQGVCNDTLIPALEMEMLFENKYNLQEDKSFDVIQSVEKPIVEYALDYSEISDESNLKKDIEELINQYNKPYEYESIVQECNKVKLCEFFVFN